MASDRVMIGSGRTAAGDRRARRGRGDPVVVLELLFPGWGRCRSAR